MNSTRQAFPSGLLQPPKAGMPMGFRCVEQVEYGDYECPHCGQAHHVVKQLRQLMGHRMSFAFRHFPLTTIHPHAQLAAEAAEAAGMQGKFWEMHYILFEHQ